MKKTLRNIAILLLLILLVAAYFGYGYYEKIFSPNVSSTLSSEYVHIPTGSTFDEVVDLLVNEKIIIMQFQTWSRR